MANLLSKDQLLTVAQQHLAAQIYLVYDQKDYRASLATLFSLINKATVGLGSVDNTSDEDKPVSSSVRDALAQKADKTEVADKQDIVALQQSIEGLVSLSTLNQAIATLTTAIASKASADDIATAITAAITPIAESLATQQQTLDAIAQSLEGGVVSAAQLDSAIDTLTQLLETRIGSLSTSFVSTNVFNTALTNLQENVGLAIGNISETTGVQLDAMSAAVETLQMGLAEALNQLQSKLDVEGFLTAEVLAQITTTVRSVMADEGVVTLGEVQW